MKRVKVFDKMQHGYEYELSCALGEQFDDSFAPDLSPKQMLSLGVFGGKYMTDCREEFPEDWFVNAELSPDRRNPSLNFFGVDASQSLTIWRQKGWIYADDPRGWFQWYCRYFMGRRIPAEDERQIRRWRAMRRHVTQIQNNCVRGDQQCRPRQRQALLHWAYDSRRI